MSELIAIIPKNSIEDIRVMWAEYKGHRYLDIRVYRDRRQGRQGAYQE